LIDAKFGLKTAAKLQSLDRLLNQINMSLNSGSQDASHCKVGPERFEPDKGIVSHNVLLENAWEYASLESATANMQ